MSVLHVCVFIGKHAGAWKDWRQEEKGMTEDEMAGWHHRLNGHEFEQTLGDSEGQGSLVSFSPWGGKESDMTKQLNNNKKGRGRLGVKLEVLGSSPVPHLAAGAGETGL